MPRAWAPEPITTRMLRAEPPEPRKTPSLCLPPSEAMAQLVIKALFQCQAPLAEKGVGGESQAAVVHQVSQKDCTTWQPTHLPARRPACLPACLSTVVRWRGKVGLCICACMSVRTHVAACLCLSLCVCLFVCLFVCMYACMYVCLFVRVC